MGGVLCSATVSQRLKMRKSLGIYYWQDSISGVKVNNNVIIIDPPSPHPTPHPLWFLQACVVAQISRTINLNL